MNFIEKYFSITDEENTITNYIHLDNNNNIKITDLEDNSRIFDKVCINYVYINKIYSFKDNNNIIRYNDDAVEEVILHNIIGLKDFIVLSNKHYTIIFISNDNHLKFSSNKNIDDNSLYEAKEDKDLSFLKLSDNHSICFLECNKNLNQKNIIEIKNLDEKRYITYTVPDDFEGTIINYEICNNVAYILSDAHILYYENRKIDDVKNIALFDNDNIYYLTNKKINDKFEIHNLTKNKLYKSFEQQITNLFSTGNDLIILIPKEVGDDQYIHQIKIIENDEEAKNIPKSKETNMNSVDKNKNKISISFYIFSGITLGILVSLMIRYIIYYKKSKKSKQINKR